MIPVRRHWEEPPKMFTGRRVRRAFKRHARRLTRLNARGMIEAGLEDLESDRVNRRHESDCTCQECEYARDFFALENVRVVIASDPAAPLAAFVRRRSQRRLDLQLAS